MAPRCTNSGGRRVAAGFALFSFSRRQGRDRRGRADTGRRSGAPGHRARRRDVRDAEMFLTRVARGMASDLEKSGLPGGLPDRDHGAGNRGPVRRARRGHAWRFSEMGNRDQARAGALRHDVRRSRSGRDHRAQPARRRAVAGANLPQPGADASRRAGIEAAGTPSKSKSERHHTISTTVLPGSDNVSPAFRFLNALGVQFCLAPTS